jgi:hypothetical protein
MKTGRLLKFHRGGTEVQAYIYREPGGFRAALYLMGPGNNAPAATLEAPTEAEVEAAARNWVETRYPRPR